MALRTSNMVQRVMIAPKLRQAILDMDGRS